MGLGSVGNAALSGHGMAGVDMSVLDVVAPQDDEAQRKYEAMGLPDPVAFAALTALGAIPNPMDMLNAMMLKAQSRIEHETHSEHDEKSTTVATALLEASTGVENAKGAGDTTGSVVRVNLDAVANADEPVPSLAPQLGSLGLPPGKSFVEAFQELQRSQGTSQEPNLSVNVSEKPRINQAGGYAAAAQRTWFIPPAPAETVVEAADLAEVEKLEERLAKQAKEVAEQAKIAAERVRDHDGSGGWVTVQTSSERGLAQAFSSAGEDDTARNPLLPPSRQAAPLPTLSSLLSGSASGGASNAADASGPDKIAISNLPFNVTDAAIRTECARHGAVTSVILQPDGSVAYVSFASPEMATTALRRMGGKPLFGGSDAVDVRIVSEMPDSVRLALTTPRDMNAEHRDEKDLPEYLKPKEGRRKRSRTRRRSRSRRQAKDQRRGRKKSRSQVRWLDRSRSNSHTATGQYIRATGCSSTVRWWEKKRESSSSRDSKPRRRSPVVVVPTSRSVARQSETRRTAAARSSSSRSRSRGAVEKQRREDVPVASRRALRARQVAIRGYLAQFVLGGLSYYYNLATGETTWERPADVAAAAAAAGQSAKGGTTGPTSMLL
eukprot:TRINITY_DN832_c0_g1_i1.p1 TRINITY_DN832_c0_g1~~TRINITY_DN832_c0_g1_i1.p1  ORF type:complete len:608 (+),score=100.45 TRINITY_DN832_c0_g1_i1:137-1960(+)